VVVAEPGVAEAPSEPDGPGGPDEPGDAAGGGGVHHQPTGSGDAPGPQETSADDD
jgi:hypothetical protein